MGSWGDKDTSNRLVSKLYCRVWEGSLHRSLGNMNISKVLHVLSYRVNCTG